MPVSARSAARRLAFVFTLAGAAALSGCATTSSYDELRQAQPSGSAFARALFKDYSYLANSFGLSETPSTTSFDASASISVANLDNDVARIADAYAQKALKASTGDEPLPEPAPVDDRSAEKLRMKLLRALDDGRTKAPSDAARAQVNYDCWVMNGRVDQLAEASANCRAAFDQSLAKLERDLNMAPAPTPAPTPAPQTTPQTPAQSPAPASSASTDDFTVHFALNSSELRGNAMTLLRKAIAVARAGRQSRITVVGHTDTSGPEAYNVGLSRRRAEQVKEALIAMGARANAIRISGTGEKDLAVKTPDGVPDAKNRRAVITLIP